MKLLCVTTLGLLLVAGIRGNYSEFGKLIGKIKKDIEPSTVYLIGVHSNYLNEISNKDFSMPVAIFTYFQSDFSSLKPVEDNIILVVQVEGNPHSYRVIEQFLLRLQVRMFVVIVADSHEVFKDYSLFFAGKKCTRIFGIVNGIGFAYLQYADVPVRRLTDDGPLPDALNDLNGFSFRTTVQTELPRAFWYRNSKGQMKVGGYVGQLFVSFVHKHNATFTDILINNSSDLFLPGLISATKNGDIDISMNPSSKPRELSISYPILFQPWTILVPLNNNVNPHDYFLRPFKLTAWICICFIIPYIVVAHLLKDFFTNEPVSLWIYFSEAFLLLLGKPTGTALIRARRIHIQVILLSHILVNIYCVYLTSFLTVDIKIEQWDTIQQLIDHNVPLLMPDYEWQSKSASGFFQDDIRKIIKPVNKSVHIKELNSMRNISFAYSASRDKAYFLLNSQRKIGKPLFRTTRDSLGEFHLGFLLDRHSPFAGILKTCIMQALDTGLIRKWYEEAVLQGHQAGLMPSSIASEILPLPLNFNQLHFAWTCLVIGWTMATIVFLGEKFCRVFGK